MAIVTGTGSLPLNIDQIDLQIVANGAVQAPTPQHIIVVEGTGESTDLYGNFTFDAVGNPTGGTLTEIAQTEGGAEAFDVSGFSIPVTEFFAWASQGDSLDAFNAILAGQDTFVGTAFDDVLRAYDGSGTFMASGGSDQFFGGTGGANSVQYSGPLIDYVITANSDGTWTVQDTRPGAPDGIETLSNIQTLVFDDIDVAIGEAPSGPVLQQVQSEFAAVFRASVATAANLPATVTLADGTTADNPTFRASLFVLPVASEIQSGLAPETAIAPLIRQAEGTTSVATLSYEFFTGSAPSAAGMDYLVSPTGPNPNNINSAYYQSFSILNRYINFAVNLGKDGAGEGAFSAAYGDLSLYDSTAKAYAVIFGVTPSDAKIQAILDPVVGSVGGANITRADYFAAYGGDGPTGLGTKAAMVGWLLGEAVISDVGTYALSNDAFLSDVALNNAPYGVDLVGHYAQPGFAYTGG